MARFFSTLMLVLIANPRLASAATFTLAPNPPAEVRFTVDAPLDSIVGISHRVSGSVSFDPGMVALEGGQVSADPASFRTGLALRDEDLRDQFFQVARYPQITLSLQKLSRTSSATLSAGQRVLADVSALFALHGVTRPLTFPVTLDRSADGSAVTIHGTFDVALADYGIERPRKLFLKLGELAKVEVQATFQVTALASATASAAPPAPIPPAKPHPPVARLNARRSLPKALQAQARKTIERRFAFPAETAAGRGERLLRDPSLGGQGNALTCESCHSTQDERLGVVEDGVILPAHSLFDVGHRQSLWQGFAATPGKASSICAKMFMLRPQGLSGTQQSDLEAYFARQSPDNVSPALDYRVLALTRKAELPHPTDGNPKNGQRLIGLYCESCHALGQIRPPLTPGLYEADYLVTRVRHLFGNDDHQMPPFSIDRLTNSELRDIVTYLAGNPAERIFKRQPAQQASAGP